MNLAVIGTGNIGLVTALCFAHKGHTVFCADIDHKKIANLQKGIAPVFEPSLHDLLQAQLCKNSIRFSISAKEAVQDAEVAFVTLGTPNTTAGLPDISAIEQFLTQLPNLNPHLRKVVIRSTVPPGTNLQLTAKFPGLHLIASPEFLREGSAIQDCLYPERVIVGSDSAADLNLFREIYMSFGLHDDQFLFMDPTSAEFSKYAANIFLASRISLMNEFSRICASTGADIKKIQQVLSTDRRIGSYFLDAGIGYGGSCFPKDIQAFINYARGINEDASITQAIQNSNTNQLERYYKLIISNLPEAHEKVLAIWGLSFKPETDDVRESVSLKLVEKLRYHYRLQLYDPKANTHAADLYRDTKTISISDCAEAALTGASALLICTDWSEFKNYDLFKMKSLLKYPVVFDGRHIYDPAHMRDLGFTYHTVGRH